MRPTNEAPAAVGRQPGQEHRRAENTPDSSTAETPTERLLARLELVRPNGRDKWMAKCPAHQDRNPSLSIRETNDGTVLVKCFAGCGASDVVAAVGLSLSDLFPNGPKAHHIPARKQHRHSAREVLAAVSHALTVITLVDAKVCDFLPLNDDEREAVAKAIRVLAKFQTEAKQWR